MRVNWRLVRFVPEAVDAWARSREWIIPGEAIAPAVTPTTVVHRILDGGGRRRSKP